MRDSFTLALLVIFIVLSQTVDAQDRGVEFVSGPTFKLSESAVAAGIDGSLTVSFEVDRTGHVKDVRVLAGPIWPCNSTPNSELKKVREAVKENILASKFSPATKDGQPIDADATLDFAIGEAYREALKGETTTKSKWVVDAANVPEQTATSLPIPSHPGFIGGSTVRVIIGEDGHVISAGTIRGNLGSHASSRRAACGARFPPTIVDGKAIKVTGLIHYEFEPWGIVRARYGSK
jgi:hypothetical protein